MPRSPSPYAVGAVPFGAIGTVTYRDGQTVYAFGHPLDGAGRRSLILADAYVYYVVNNPNVAGDTSFKLAAPGHIVGTLTSDTPDAVIGTVGAPPTTIPVDVTRPRSRHRPSADAAYAQAADETDIGMPLGSSLARPGRAAGGRPGRDARSITVAPANESGRMCLTVAIREIRGPLRFCNRYVSTGAPRRRHGLPPALSLSASTDAERRLA